jgi:hypothetical protein
MRPKKHLPQFAALGGLFLLAACGGGTQFSGVWVDPTYQDRQLQRILVVGVSENQTGRLMWESEMAAQLKHYKVDAIPSSTILPRDEMLSEAMVKENIAGKDIDGILVTRVMSVDQHEEYVPGTTYTVPSTYYNWYGYYSMGYSVVHDPGYTYTSTTANLESNLYDATNGKLIWAAISHTYDPRSVEDVVHPVSQRVADELKRENLLPE